MAGGGEGGAAVGVGVAGRLAALMTLASDLFAWSLPLPFLSSASTVSIMAVVTHCLAATINPLQRVQDQVVKYQGNVGRVKIRIIKVFEQPTCVIGPGAAKKRKTLCYLCQSEVPCCHILDPHIIHNIIHHSPDQQLFVGQRKPSPDVRQHNKRENKIGSNAKAF